MDRPQAKFAIGQRVMVRASHERFDDTVVLACDWHDDSYTAECAYSGDIGTPRTGYWYGLDCLPENEMFHEVVIYPRPDPGESWENIKAQIKTGLPQEVSA